MFHLLITDYGVSCYEGHASVTFRSHFFLNNPCTVPAHMITCMYGQMWMYIATGACPEGLHVIQYLLPFPSVSYKSAGVETTPHTWYGYGNQCKWFDMSRVWFYGACRL